MTELTRDRCNVVYIADDAIARISQEVVMPTEEYSLVKRYIFPSEGRYRIHGMVSSNDKNGGGNIIKFYKNGKELLKEQLCLSGEDTQIDLRLLCNKNEYIDIEASVADYEGFNYSTWDLKIENIGGTVRDLENTTTGGYTYNVTTSKKLSEYITEATTLGTGLYTEVYGVRYPMTYDSATRRWQETAQDKTGITKIPKASRETLVNRIVLEDAGYVSADRISSTKNWTPGSMTIVDVPIDQTGCLLIDGNFVQTSEKDAELVKVYLNNECIWSNRIGGEESIKFDEPYDTKYFIDNIHTFVNVEEGDVVSFRVGKWRVTTNKAVDISNVNLSYVREY